MKFSGIVKRYIACALLLGGAHLLASAQDNSVIISSADVFVSGTEGYHTYRIPAIITSKKGVLLAFCEGRKNGKGDSGDIDVLLKRSKDGGKTWEERQVIWDDGNNTCGNPCPVLDEQTGTVWLLLTHNTGADKEVAIVNKQSPTGRKVYACKSDDEGASWSAPQEITPSVKEATWGWYATGPGVGIQIKNGPHKGRLVIPCDHSYDDPGGNLRNGPYEYGSHIIYSDDHGSTWQLGGSITPKVNECQVVEIADGNGTLLMNMRSYFGRNCRTHAWSYDGGLTWSSPEDVAALMDPVCQAAFIRYSWPGKKRKSILLFLNPASKKRRNMTLRASYDEGKTWPVIRTLYAGPAGYSCMSLLSDGNIGCLYEKGKDGPYATIGFDKVSAHRFFKQSLL